MRPMCSGTHVCAVREQRRSTGAGKSRRRMWFVVMNMKMPTAHLLQQPVRWRLITEGAVALHGRCVLSRRLAAAAAAAAIAASLAAVRVHHVLQSTRGDASAITPAPRDTCG